MNKLLSALFFSLFLGFSGSTLGAATKPTTTVDSTCTALAKTYRGLGEARNSGVSALQLMGSAWELQRQGRVTEAQVAHMLTILIEVYSSPATPDELYQESYKACMKAQGKINV